MMWDWLGRILMLSCAAFAVFIVVSAALIAAGHGQWIAP